MNSVHKAAGEIKVGTHALRVTSIDGPVSLYAREHARARTHVSIHGRTDRLGDGRTDVWTGPDRTSPTDRRTDGPDRTGPGGRTDGKRTDGSRAAYR